ncbi:MAG: DUF4416 family protein [Deltaproteobacteria bacterium]|nr:DUF4416 family protein [Deltaproteobacteria bacterium]
MGKPSKPRPAKLFMSLIAGEDDIVYQGMEALRKDFGTIDFVSEKFQFDFTDYYTEEMGRNLFRHFITFEKLIGRDSLPEIKLATNHLEERLAGSNGNRQINIDPGYLSHAHVILATTKAYAHRPYLEKGIYADLTLIYRGKSFQALEWTYPDYRQEATIELFNQIRKQYLEMIKEGKE